MLNILDTPAYIYDLRELDRNARLLKETFSQRGVRLLFATMANDLPEILEHLKHLEFGVCVNSSLHLRACLSSGFTAETIHFTASGISEEDMKLLAQLGVHVNLDSLSQVQHWVSRTGSNSAGIRIATSSLGLPQSGIERLGVEASEVHRHYRGSQGDDFEVAGVHAYFGTNHLDDADLQGGVARLFDLAATLPRLKYVNVGGGAGVDYSRCGRAFPIQDYADFLGQQKKRICSVLGRNIEVIFEPGRAVTASCGTYATRVTDVKLLRGRRIICVDGSIANFPRPFHQPGSYHQARKLHATGRSTVSPAVIVGRTTFSKDILSECVLDDDLVVGDVLLFEDAGAYCYTMMSRFLGQPEVVTEFTNSPRRIGSASTTAMMAAN